MKWFSHKIITGFFMYAVTGDIAAAVISAAGSVFPDAVEFGHSPRRHRKLSHWWVLYAFAMIVVYTLLRVRFGGLSGFSLGSFMAADGADMVLIGIFYFLSGCLFHIGQDALCGYVPILNPARRTFGVKLFRVGSLTEYLITTAIAVTLLIFPLKVGAFCFEEAGDVYGINPKLLWAIAKVESDFKPDAINKNKNGSYDYGLMQINTCWYGTIGHERWMKLSDPCENVMTGAMILKQCIDRHGYTWDAVGCYNSGNKTKGRIYSWKVYRALLTANKIQSDN